MKKLATQLEQARQEIAEKEAESRAWEERAAGLSQQMKEEHNKLEVLCFRLYIFFLTSLTLTLKLYRSQSKLGRNSPLS